MRAVQNSTSTHASNSLTYPVTDCINVANEGTLLYTTPTDGLVGGTVTYQQSARLDAFIMGPGTLQGFSFQHFGGYSPATMQVTYTMTVSARTGNSFRNRTITFTLSSIGATKDGSMTFIPFSPGFFSASPSLLVGSIAYSGDDVQNVNNGDIVGVTLTTNRTDGGGVMCTAYPVQQPVFYLIGSLVTNINISPQTFGGSIQRTNNYDINPSSVPVEIFNSTVLDIAGVGLNGIRLYQIVLNGINFTTTPTTSAPAKLTIRIDTTTGHYWEIKVTCNRNPDSSMIVVPLNMPAPGDEYSESDAVNNNSSIFVTSVRQGDIGVTQFVTNRGVNLLPTLINAEFNVFALGVTASYPAISRQGTTISISPTTFQTITTPFEIRIAVTLTSDSPATMRGNTPACLFKGTS
jgi:hypothetical protein